MNLNEMRDEVNEIDAALLPLFLKRMELSKEIAEYKEENNLPIINRGRERDILKWVMSQSPDELRVYSHRLYTMIMELSRSYQSSLTQSGSRVRDKINEALANTESVFPREGTIACQGVEGAYSQMAADRIFPRGNIVYFKSFEGVFNAVLSGLCDFGILPIENSSNGSVRAVYELLQKKDVTIVRTHRLCVRHELLAKAGTKLSDIREIHSHSQALGQCSEFLKSLNNVKIVPCDNTAMAAKYAAESDKPGIAAISSGNCAELYGLKPIEGVEIQNSDNNYTRFICITKDAKIYPGANRIHVMLTCEHRPGTLYDVLADISALELNLIKLESCPMVGHDFEFLFFLELEGSVLEPKVVGMLENLEHTCRTFRYLGNYMET